MAAIFLDLFADPFTIGKVAVSPGGANQITVVAFPGLPANAVISVIVANDMQITDRGDDAAAIDDDFAFDVFAGGTNEIASSGWGSRKNLPSNLPNLKDPYIRIASSVQNAAARFLITRLPS
jgi:hypothetical protein